MVNLTEIIERIKEAEKLHANKEVAILFDISAPDFSKRKKSGSLLPLIIDWGISKKVNMHWLLTGEGDPYSNKEAGEEDGIKDKKTSDTPVKIDLLKRIITRVEHNLALMKKSLEPDKKAELIMLLYEYFDETGKDAEKEVVERYLKLVA